MKNVCFDVANEDLLLCSDPSLPPAPTSDIRVLIERHTRRSAVRVDQPTPLRLAADQDPDLALVSVSLCAVCCPVSYGLPSEAE